MNIRDSYNTWASQYDSNHNKTRDLEKKVLRDCLQNIAFSTCLEIGCGTGKNTEWLTSKARVTAVDFSEEMLRKAREKQGLAEVAFIQADITKAWNFSDDLFDLITFSLVLEHVEDLYHIFKEAAKSLQPGGYIYLGELHPFKQYSGSKARFDTEAGRQELTCFNHHISDFIKAAKVQSIVVVDLDEYFDDDLDIQLPRILSIVFKKV